jgi:glyoxylase-like metal-dependent hydrolase (beta-lactamase superfamily II)
VARNEAPPIVIGGDVLFAGSIGRSDFPGGDGQLLVSGIRSRLFNLPDETRVLPGHGPETTIGIERLRNPYVGERAERSRLD